MWRPLPLPSPGEPDGLPGAPHFMSNRSQDVMLSDTQTGKLDSFSSQTGQVTVFAKRAVNQWSRKYGANMNTHDGDFMVGSGTTEDNDQISIPHVQPKKGKRFML